MPLIFIPVLDGFLLSVAYSSDFPGISQDNRRAVNLLSVAGALTPQASPCFLHAVEKCLMRRQFVRGGSDYDQIQRAAIGVGQNLGRTAC
jgi:hypothetical protein